MPTLHTAAMRRSLLCLLLMIFALLVGCTRELPLTFSEGEEAQKLPEGQRTQLKTTLTKMFGTPEEPRWMTPKEEEETEEEDVDSESEETQPELVLDEDFEKRAILKRGAEVYRARCAGCHGDSGDGAGPAASHLHPKPRDYRRGVFKFTSTPFGAKPSRSDLVRTIRRGAKGTSMPGFPWMTQQDMDAVIDYVIWLSQRGEVERTVARIVEIDYDEGDPIENFEFTDAISGVRTTWDSASQQIVQPVTPEPPYNRESVLAGRKIFLTDNCWKCHGKDAKGQMEWLSHEFLAKQESLPPEERVQINRDDWGEIAPAADITARMLHGGRRPIDIYRRIYTGINGTPMPAFAQSFAKEPDKIWHLVHYVLHIVETGETAPEESTPPSTGD